MDLGSQVVMLGKRPADVIEQPLAPLVAEGPSSGAATESAVAGVCLLAEPACKRLASEEAKTDPISSECAPPLMPPASPVTATAGVINSTAAGASFKLTKHRMAFLVAYLGTGYQGLQKNPDARSIEAELEEAMYKAGGIAEADRGNQGKVGWQRCARTDKGVHAVGQVVSLKYLVPRTPEELARSQGAIIAGVNAQLPAQIRVLGMQRVTDGFNAKNQCSSRTYEYLLPPSLLRPSARALAADPSLESRTAETEFEQLTQILKMFEGTHSFHNFTARLNYTAKSATRYILSIRTKLVRLQPSEQALISIVLHGQSFLLHMIRKIVGACVALVRDNAFADARQLLQAYWGPLRVPLSMAPGFSLLLQKCHFDFYNTLLKQKLTQQQPLSFDHLQAEKDQFLETTLYPHVIELEQQQQIFQEWLQLNDRNPLNYAQVLLDAEEVRLGKLAPGSTTRGWTSGRPEEEEQEAAEGDD
jgi:tRNA pseudouridine38-40 synthase